MSRTTEYADAGQCQGCGKSILWIEVEGKRIPLDPVPPVYDIDMMSAKGWKRSLTASVSHFATCPKASQFSGRNKPAAAAAPARRDELAQDDIDADTVVPFGKYQGKTLAQVPAHWLLWAFDNIEPRTPFTRGLLNWIEENRETIEERNQEERDR